MNVILKIGVLATVITMGMFQTGCGPYYPYYVEEEWVIEEEVVVSESVGYFSHERLTFQIVWDEYGNHPDLATSLVTPLGSLIDEGGPELDGCYFLGTYNETSTQKVSMIECVDPFHGLYDLQIENLGFVTRYPTIKVLKEYQNGHGVTQQVFSQTTSVYSGDNAVIHYTF